MSMGQIVELDPRVVPFEKKLKMAGVAVVAATASGVVIVGGLSIIAAVGVGLAVLAAVNFGIPVGARYIALKKQQALTALAETFSEETIREDERQEGNRLAEQQRLYTTQSAEFGNVIEELSSNLNGATQEERDLLQGQIDQLNGVLNDAETAIKEKVADLAELKRVNKIYVGLHKAAKAMKGSQDLTRNAEEIQRIETARNAIKTRMREALAGQKLEAMNAPLQTRLSVAKVAQLASSPTTTIQPITIKEETRVPTRR
jgi:hypothetical protein